MSVIRAGLLCLAALAAAAPARAGSVWFTDGTAVVRWQHETGTFAMSGDVAPVVAIAPMADGGAWVLRGGVLTRLSADFARGASVELSEEVRDATAALAADAGGGVWHAARDVVRRHADDGTLVAQWRHDGPIDDLAVGGPAAVFVVSADAVTQYDADGRTVRRVGVAVGDAAVRGRRLLLDRTGGYLWVVTGREAIQLDALAGLAPRARVTTPDPHVAMALDGAAGTLWLAGTDAVRAFDREGRLLDTHRPPSDLAPVHALAADPALPVAWVGSPAGLVAFNARTAQWIGVTAGAPAALVAVPPLALRPVLAPAVAGSPPALRLRLGADCGGVPCAPSAGYLDTLVLRADAGGRDASGQFARDDDAGDAVLAMRGPEPADAPSLTASVVDAWGVSSAAVTVELPLRDEPMRAKANALPAVALTAPANNATYVAPASVTVAATATDSDGTIARVEFLRNGTLLAADTAAPYTYAWTGVAAGTYTLAAKAYDNAGGVTTSAAVTVLVKANVAPTVRIAAPANGALYTAPATIDIGVTAVDADGKVTKVELFQGATRIATLTAAPWTYRWVNVGGGSYSLTAKATDDKGAATTSAAVAVKVNRPPTAALTAPANGAALVAPVNLTLQASATDADGTVAKVEFLANGAVRATDTASPYSHVWSNVPVGTHTLAARATDNLGAATTSAPVTITVAANTPPTVAITAPATGTQVVAGVPVTFAATASDADGTIAKVEFFVNDGAGNYRFATDTAAPYGATYVFSEQSCTVTAVATDNKGLTAVSAPVAITAIANRPPAVVLTSPVADAVVVSVAPPDIALNATATDPDGRVTAVRFYAQPRPWQEGDAPVLLAALTAAPYEATWAAVPHTGGLVDGRYVEAWEVWAEATDDANATTASDLAAVTVVATAPRTVTINAPRETVYGGAIVFAAPATIVLAARASTFAGAPALTRVEFLADGAPIGTVTTANAATGEYVLVWRDVAAGQRQVVARATDAGGATTESAPVAIRVAARNRAPVVALTSPGNGQVFGSLAGTPTIALAATASDPDGTVASVRFLANGRFAAGDSAAPYTGSFAPTSGQYAIHAVAVDDRGGETLSLPVFAYVPVTRRAPFVVVTSPAANSTVAAGTPVTIAADIVAPDGSIEMVEFYDGPYRIAQKTAPPWTHTYALWEGVHALRVYALQAFAPDTMSLPVVVNAVGSGGGVLPEVALAAPAEGQAYLAPATVALAVTVDDPQARLTRVDYVAGTQTVASATLPPYTASWSGAAPGVYELFAVGRFDGGARTTLSPPRTISVRQNEFVELAAPAAGAAFPPGDPITLEARAGVRAGVARIEFRAGGAVLGSVAVAGAPTVATARFTWAGAPPGQHAVEARAYAADGAATTMLPVAIVVASLAVTVVEPYAGQVHYAPAGIRIVADAVAGAGTIDRVDFYGDGVLLGSRTAAPYQFLWTGVAAGTHTVSARVRDAAGVFASSLPVSTRVVAAASLQADPGVDGSSVADDAISFGGTVVAPANAAVIVNGRLAPHDRAGRFFVNGVPLAPGSNVVTLVVNSQDAAPVTQTITVTSTGVQPFRAWLSEAEGLAPFAPTLTIANRGNAAFQRVEVDMQDDGSVDATLTSLPDGMGSVTLHYSLPGVYTVRVRVVAAGGAIVFEAVLKARARAPSELAATVTGVYRSLVDRMLANDANGALGLFVGDAQARYADILGGLGAALPGVAAQLGTPIDGVVTDDWAELTLLRPTTGGDRVFMLYLIRGGDGLWRMENM